MSSKSKVAVLPIVIIYIICARSYQEETVMICIAVVLPLFKIFRFTFITFAGLLALLSLVCNLSSQYVLVILAF